MLIVSENMNAKVGDQNWDHERAMGNHGLGEIKDNGERLCEWAGNNRNISATQEDSPSNMGFSGQEDWNPH